MYIYSMFIVMLWCWCECLGWEWLDGVDVCVYGMWLSGYCEVDIEK